MTKSRLEKASSSFSLINLLKNLLMLTGILTIIFLVFFAYSNSQSEIKLDIEEIHLDSLQTQGMDSVDIQVKQNSVNHQITKLLANMPENPFGLKMAWQDREIQGQLNLPFQGQTLPASFTAQPIQYQNQLGLEIKSIEIANLPLPLNQAYQEVANNIQLPEGFYFSNNQALVQVDLNEIIKLKEPNFIQVKSIDLDNKLLNLQVFFDPNHLISE